MEQLFKYADIAITWPKGREVRNTDLSLEIIHAVIIGSHQIGPELELSAHSPPLYEHAKMSDSSMHVH